MVDETEWSVLLHRHKLAKQAIEDAEGKGLRTKELSERLYSINQEIRHFSCREYMEKHRVAGQPPLK